MLAFYSQHHVSRIVGRGRGDSLGWGRGDGVFGEWVPTATAPFGAKIGSGQRQTKNIIGTVACKLFVCFYYFVKYVTFIVGDFEEEFRSLL